MYCAVYIMTNRHRTVFYTGVTSDLQKRMIEHVNGVHPSSFTKRYNLDQLVYYEIGRDIRAAIEREKKVKKWSREKKIALIESMNPDWRDLAPEVIRGFDD